MAISRSGFAKRASTSAACTVRGVRARFLVGRLERGSAEVGIDSGMGSDMVVAGAVRRDEVLGRLKSGCVDRRQRLRM